VVVFKGCVGAGGLVVYVVWGGGDCDVAGAVFYFGTNGATLFGTKGAAVVFGTNGAAVVFGTNGAAVVFGTNGAAVFGTNGTV